MSFRLTLTRLAKLDLDEIIVFLGQRSPVAAVELVESILRRIELLQAGELLAATFTGRAHPLSGALGISRLVSRSEASALPAA